jgi:AcrR family transcriptional regulator
MSPARPIDPENSQRRAQLLEAAVRRLLAEGYEKTSVSAIVREAGVAQGTFYLYFSSKTDMIGVLRRQTLRDYIAAFEAGAARAEEADESLVCGILETKETLRQKLPLLRVFREASSESETEAGLLKGREAFAVPLARVLARGVSQGRFDCADPRLDAHLILAALDTLLYEALEYQHPAPLPETLHHAISFILRALGVPRSRMERLLSLLSPP